MTDFFSELKRRRVYQSAAIYAVVAWGLAQAVDFFAARLFTPEWVSTLTATGPAFMADAASAGNTDPGMYDLFGRAYTLSISLVY